MLWLRVKQHQPDAQQLNCDHIWVVIPGRLDGRHRHVYVMWGDYSV